MKTSRKKEEKKNSLFIDAIKTAYDTIILTDMRGNITYVNDATLKTFDYSYEEIIHCPVFNLIENSQKDLFAEAIQKEKWNGETVGIKRNNDKFSILASISLTKDEEGLPIGTLLIIKDITERRYRESRMHRVDVVYRLKNKIASIFLTSTDNKKLYKEIIDIIINITHSEGGIIGYIQPDGALVTVVSVISNKLREKYCFPETMMIISEVKKNNPFYNSVTKKRRINTNKDNWMLKEHIQIDRIMSIPILYDNEIIGIAQVINKKNNYTKNDKKIFQDCVSEIAPYLYIKLKKEFQHKLLLTAEAEKNYLEKKRLQSQKMESLGTLAAGIAHEINTPIQFIGNNAAFILKGTTKLFDCIKTYRELLFSSGSSENPNPFINQVSELEEKFALSFLEKEIPMALNAIKEGIDRVAKIVKAMRDFSHMGSDRKERTDINKAIESTITISKNEWKYVADIKTDLTPSLLVECFIWDIKQVILNLIVNAAQAIKDMHDEQSDKKGLITVTTRKEDNQAIIAVGDTGTGIPEDIRDKIFDSFFTTKKVGQGTGQGLSMAYTTIIHKHKGKIRFETEMGKGTTFFISLPLYSEKEQEE